VSQTVPSVIPSKIEELSPPVSQKEIKPIRKIIKPPSMKNI
jgi:hypothetical protein